MEPAVVMLRAVRHRNMATAGKEATPAGGESGGRRTVRLRGGRAGAATHESLVATGQSYQRVSQNGIRPGRLPLCCRTVGGSVETESTTTAAAFFDLDKTIISRSSTLAFAPSFYRYGLISRTEALRGACAQLVFRLGGAGQAGQAGPASRSAPGQPQHRSGEGDTGG